jgi:general secretion pathway protein N
MRRFLVVVLLLLVAAAAAIRFCPAGIGYRYLMKPSKTVVLSELSGTIWNGHAGSIAVHDHPLGRLDWHLHLMPLLQGQRVADFTISGDMLKVQGTLTRSPAGNTFDNLGFTLPASAATDMLHISANADGDITGSAASLTLVDGWPTQLRDGKAQWSKAVLEQTEFGAIEATFNTGDDGDVVGAIKNTGGAGQFSGSLKLSPQHDLEVNDFDYKLPAQLAADVLHLADAKLSGEIKGKLAHFVLKSGATLAAARGNLRWNNAATAAIPHDLIGDIEATFDTVPDGGIAGTLKNRGGSAQFNGAFKLTPQHDLEFNELAFKLPAPLAATILRMPNATAEGDIAGKFARLVLRGGSTPAEARGNLRWSNAATAAIPHDLLGDVDVTFDSAGGIGGTLKNEGGHGSLATKWKFGADHALELTDATLRFPASLLSPLTHLSGIAIDGDIEGNFTRLTLREGLWPRAVAGKLVWHGMAVSGAHSATLGDVEWNLGTDPDGSIIGVLNDLGGPLQVDGMFKVGKTTYEASAKLTARGGDATLRAALLKVGTPQPDGSTIVETKGEFGKK